MAWFITENIEEYLAAAGEFLLSRLAENTVLVTVAETLRARGLAAFGDAAPLFGWWREAGGPIEGAFVHTPPNPVLLTTVPPAAVESLVASWPRGRPLSGVNAPVQVTSAFASYWHQGAAAAPSSHRREHLYRLGDLTAPQPKPAGRPRAAGAADKDLLVAWITAFQEETGGAAGNAPRRVDDRLSYGGFTLWEVDGARCRWPELPGRQAG